MRAVAASALTLLTLAGLAGAGVAAQRQPGQDGPPSWSKRPSPDELSAVWPAAAKGRPGRAVIRCTVTVQGVLRDCRVLSEQPANAGFGPAALLLAPTFIFNPAMAGGKAVEGVITIPINWEGDVSGGESFRIATNLPWAATPTPADMAAVYPAALRDKGAIGHVVMRCALTQEGKLRACEKASAEPDSTAVLQAARAMTAKFQARVGDADARTIRGLRVSVPFHFAPPPPQQRYLGKADWTRRLTSDAVLGAFPDKATKAGLSTGRGVVDCLIARDGALTDCKPIEEDPSGMDFGVMAVQLAQLMAVNAWSDEGLPAEGARLRVPIRFQAQDVEPPPAPAPQ